MIIATAKWLASPKYFWLCVIVTALALIVSFSSRKSESVIRLTGLVLQLLGVLTVMWGIAKTRKYFGLQSLLSAALTWMRRAPFLHVHHQSVSVHAEMTPASVRFRGQALHVVCDPPTLESRIDALERNFEVTDHRISRLSEEFDMEVRNVKRQLGGEQNLRTQQVASMHAKLKEFATGGLQLSATGAVWIFVGLVLSTSSPEIAALLGGA